MNRLRLLIAVLSAGALLVLGSVVALAAPAALGQAVSPSAGAAQAEYCPPGELARRQAALNAYSRQMAKAKARYFKLVKSKKKRTAFVKKQVAQRNALKRAVSRCD